MEKPILFSTEMVKAILARRKTKTRRLNGLKGINQNPDQWSLVQLTDGKETPIVAVFVNQRGEKRYVKPYWQPGDTLWVKETWCKDTDLNINAFEFPMPQGNYYRANAALDWANDREVVKWRPSIYMSRKAARLFLAVRSIRIERLQDITEADAMAEGIKVHVPVPGDGQPMPILQFKNLWDSINMERGFGWDVNPWVWVVEFERAEVKGA